ncbi:ANK_REP_REGION domain-containing protein [Trichoderma simmonsii]|uniref:ANK_REP_REGION domain-containing protein n=1 Tax=Trichoderma simmonsii TaxID=1491479 RepID=A0A8G0LL17_9HYPO|nr:ANK_REP_REGION domain-containing protein [Trichoderma simmonsii]
MSLGLELDFLAVVGLVKQIRKSFIGAPEQFKAISDDVRGFCIVLQDIEANCTELGPEQTQEYQSVVTSCKHLLVRLKRTLEEYSDVAKDDKTGKRTAIKRVWKRLKWEPDDIRDIRSQISVKIATLRSLNDQVTSHNIVKLIRQQENTEREATIKWVSDINYVAQQNDIFLRCQTGSRKWLFESEIYLEWLRRKGSLLFCPGNPGTGKTFTTAMVVESLRLANDAETLTAYMYCSYQNYTQTVEKLLCSLLRVALEEADYEADGAVSNCKQLRLSNKVMSRSYCVTLLQDLFFRFTRVNLIVDALDELTNEVRRPLIYDLLKLHQQSNVSLFVTSRGIPEIQHLFEGCEAYTSLEVRSSDEDIRNFLRDNIFQLPNFVARSQKLQDEVINSVTNASAGMFLLAELYLKSLANIISVGSLRTRLSNLAIGSNAYDALYEDSMLRIGFQGPELEHIATQMLLVLTCARRPLSPKELSHALSIDESSEAFDEDMVPEVDDLVAACTGLVVLDDTSNVVHLVHKSAAEYFERTRSRWFPKANEKMAFICLRYLQIAETEPDETMDERAPFFCYAKANWSYHSLESEKETVIDPVMSDASQTNSAIDSNTSPTKPVVTQLTIQQMTKEIVNVDSSIIEACHAGHQAWVELLLVVRNYDMNKHGLSQKKLMSVFEAALVSRKNPVCARDKVLLTIAAARGDYGMAQMLLARGADPNIFNTNGQTPLFIAATNGFDNLVSLLLDQNLIKPDLMCQHSRVCSTAFLASIELERVGCFRMLVEKSDRRARDSHGRGAMWLAAVAGYSGIISELLKWPDVETDYASTKFCGNPLTVAIRGGYEEAALLLLPYSKCRGCSRCGITPMHYAVRDGRHKLLERLLENDASAVDSELQTSPYCHNECQGWDPQIYCAWREKIIKQKTPLLAAISLQDMQATQLLLPYSDSQHLSRQLIHEIAQWDNTELFELLLRQANVKLGPVDEHGKTPFPLDAKHAFYEIINMLIKLGDFQFDRKDVADAAEDHIIANCNYTYCFHLLESVANRDINKRDSTGSSLLHLACRLHLEIMDKSRSEFVADLLETNTGPLVTELLMRPGVDVNLLDGEGKTPLLIAVKNHRRDVVRLLLEREDTDVLAQDENGNDALLLASVYEPMFEQLFPWRASSMNHDLPLLRGQVPARYRVDHWPEVLNAEFKEYDESIFSMLIHDKRTQLYRTNFKGERVVNRVAMTGTKSMIQTLAETTELASELEFACIYPDGKNILSLALQKNQDDGAVDLLIAHCSTAILQQADATGRTPLSHAVQRATSQATRSLLAADVDTNAADSFGLTPLSYATDKRYRDAACLLIAVDKTQVNLPDRGGLTPLMHAILDMNIPLLSALLDRSDIDVLATDKEGHSFLCYLLESHYFRDMHERELEQELESVINRIHQLLQLRARDTKAFIHTPFICTLEGDGAFDGMYSLQRFAILLEIFHPGLDFSRCATTAGLSEILGEDNHGVYSDNRDLGLRALRLFDNKDI